MTQPTIPTKLELFEMFLDGTFATWDAYIAAYDALYPMPAEEYERRLALAWTPSILVGCAP